LVWPFRSRLYACRTRSATSRLRLLAACRREIFCAQINADKLRFLVLERPCPNFKTILQLNLSLSEQSEYKSCFSSSLRQPARVACSQSMPLANTPSIDTVENTVSEDAETQSAESISVVTESEVDSAEPPDTIAQVASAENSTDVVSTAPEPTVPPPTEAPPTEAPPTDPPPTLHLRQRIRRRQRRFRQRPPLPMLHLRQRIRHHRRQCHQRQHGFRRL